MNDEPLTSDDVKKIFEQELVEAQWKPGGMQHHTHNGVDSYPLVQKLTAGTAIILSPSSGLGTVTVSSGVSAGTAVVISSTGTISNVGVTQVVAGSSISVTPSNGTGVVTVAFTGTTGLSFDARSHTTASVNTIQNTDVIIRSLSGIPGLGANDMLVVTAEFGAGGGTPTLKLKVGSGTITNSSVPVNSHNYVYRWDIRMMNSTAVENTFQTQGDYSANSFNAADDTGSVDLSSTFQLDFVVNDSNLSPVTHTSKFFDIYRIKG